MGITKKFLEQVANMQLSDWKQPSQTLIFKVFIHSLSKKLVQQNKDAVLKVYESRYIVYLGTSDSKRETTN